MSWFIGFGISFAVVAAVACFFAGPIGILYALGWWIFYGVVNGLAALMDPKTFSKSRTPPDREATESLKERSKL